jgi:hypothetical protein
MATAFEEVVRDVVERLRFGRVLLIELVRAGRRRAISLGTYRTATSTKRGFALCVLPAIAGGSECTYFDGPDRAAREFVRLAGVASAREALRREAQKNGPVRAKAAVRPLRAGSMGPTEKSAAELEEDIGRYLASSEAPRASHASVDDAGHGPSAYGMGSMGDHAPVPPEGTAPQTLSAREFRELIDHVSDLRASLQSCLDHEVLHESKRARRGVAELLAARLKRPSPELERQREAVVRATLDTANARLDRLGLRA